MQQDITSEPDSGRPDNNMYHYEDTQNQGHMHVASYGAPGGEFGEIRQGYELSGSYEGDSVPSQSQMGYHYQPANENDHEYGQDQQWDSAGPVYQRYSQSGCPNVSYQSPNQTYPADPSWNYDTSSQYYYNDPSGCRETEHDFYHPFPSNNYHLPEQQNSNQFLSHENCYAMNDSQPNVPVGFPSHKPQRNRDEYSHNYPHRFEYNRKWRPAPRHRNYRKPYSSESSHSRFHYYPRDRTHKPTPQSMEEKSTSTKERKLTETAEQSPRNSRLLSQDEKGIDDFPKKSTGLEVATDTSDASSRTVPAASDHKHYTKASKYASLNSSAVKKRSSMLQHTCSWEQESKGPELVEPHCELDSERSKSIRHRETKVVEHCSPSKKSLAGFKIPKKSSPSQPTSVVLHENKMKRKKEHDQSPKKKARDGNRKCEDSKKALPSHDGGAARQPDEVVEERTVATQAVSKGKQESGSAREGTDPGSSSTCSVAAPSDPTIDPVILQALANTLLQRINAVTAKKGPFKAPQVIATVLHPPAVKKPPLDTSEEQSPAAKGNVLLNEEGGSDSGKLCEEKGQTVIETDAALQTIETEVFSDNIHSGGLDKEIHTTVLPLDLSLESNAPDSSAGLERVTEAPLTQELGDDVFKPESAVEQEDGVAKNTSSVFDSRYNEYNLRDHSEKEVKADSQSQNAIKCLNLEVRVESCNVSSPSIREAGTSVSRTDFEISEDKPAERNENAKSRDRKRKDRPKHSPRKYLKKARLQQVDVQNEDEWKCALCERGTNVLNLGVLFGPYSMEATCQEETDSSATELWVHDVCAIWSPGVCLIGQKLIGLKEAFQESKNMHCSKCNRPGATLCCKTRGCKCCFHYPCAHDAGCVFDEDQYTLVCMKHKQK